MSNYDDSDNETIVGEEVYEYKSIEENKRIKKDKILKELREQIK